MSEDHKIKELEADINSMYEEIKALAERVSKLEDEIEKRPVADDELDAEEEDELYKKAVELVRETGKCSTSYIQRKLKTGYARTARIIDIMEKEGIVGPGGGSKPREVYKNK